MSQSMIDVAHWRARPVSKLFRLAGAYEKSDKMTSSNMFCSRS